MDAVASSDEGSFKRKFSMLSSDQDEVVDKIEQPKKDRLEKTFEDDIED